MKNTALVLASLFAFLGSAHYVHADESTTNKVKDDAGDVSTATKKAVRKGKRKVRKATGNDSATKDVKDKANDIGDDVSNDVNKAKRDH